MRTLTKLAVLLLLGTALGTTLSACTGMEPERPAARFEGNGGYNGGP